MAWFTRFTRFGDIHFVFGQEQGNTCGPASALMCYTKINKLSPTATSYGDTGRAQELYEQWLGRPYDGAREGTYPAGLVHALNQMNCGRWTHTNFAPMDTSAAIIRLVGTVSTLGPTIDVSPIIVGVNWDGSRASHWVCIDTVRNFLGTNYATICDPWDANVHIQEMRSNSQFVYDAEPVMGIDLGGTHYEYSQPSTGRVRVWPIIHQVAG